MKLYIQRGAGQKDGFTVYNEKAEPISTAVVRSGGLLGITIYDRSRSTVSEIRLNSFMLNYFSIRCCHRLYVLIPCSTTRFAFAIYGSTYRCMGSLADGRFSMIDSHGSTVMTQKKCRTPHGEGYELDISDRRYTLFMLSVAICADIYLTLSDTNPLAVSN